ncbi:MAG: S8 family peptidase [Pseudonocardiaceae bacterium]
MVVHELRVVVQTDASLPEVERAVGAILPALTSAAWRVEPLFAEQLPDRAALYLVATASDEPLGTAEYAKQAHTLAQRLIDTGRFSRVEADVPVRPWDRPDVVGIAGDPPDPPGSDLNWARESIHCAQAWALPPPPGGRTQGEGIRVGHPDSGYSDHFALGPAALDLGSDRDVIDNDDDALDPLVPPDRSPWPLPSPGHGTATGSVIAGHGSAQVGVVGVAPRATLVPIRAVESVVQFFDSDVARAVDHARQVNCHVVSMSLGGQGFFALREAIQRAVDSGMIVMAAAGNVYPFVVEPASYDNCLAVAAVGVGDLRWPGSASGSAVDVSAPGWAVHVAGFGWDAAPPTRFVGPSSGTSFAVAHLAGVAALWLAFHGRDKLIERYSPFGVQPVFLHLLRTVGRRVPPDWPAGWGAGVVDAEALLSAPLPNVVGLRAATAAGSPDDPVSRLSVLLDDADPDAVRRALEVRLHASGPQLDRLLHRFEGELAYHVVNSDAFRDSLLIAAGALTAGPVIVPEMSPHLAAAVAGAAPT